MDRLSKILSLLPSSFPDHQFIFPLGDLANLAYSVADSPRSFYLLGSMGMTIPVGLGVATASGLRTLVFEGDGGLLMNLGGLASVAKFGPDNLSIVIVDNGAYVSTGCQEVNLSSTQGIEHIARSCGLVNVCTFDTGSVENDILNWVGRAGLRLAVLKTQAKKIDAPFVPLAPEKMTARFIASCEQARPLNPDRDGEDAN